jgi:phage-related minor tail protein
VATSIADLFMAVRPKVARREFKTEGAKAGEQMGDGLDRGIRKGVEQGAEKAGKDGGKKVSDGMSKGLAGGKIKDGMSSALSAGLAKFGPAAAGAAVGAALVKGISLSMEKESAQAKLGAQLGLDPAQAKEFGAIAGRIYAGAWGESLGQVSGAVRLVTQNISNLQDEGSEGVEAMTKNVLDLSTAFEIDLGAATRGVGQLLKTGLARNANEAMDVITAGFQAGVDKSEDFLDTLNEYGTQFRKLGISGATATGILSQGLKAGARDADVVADSLKEFAIRAVDGSKLTEDSFKSLGLSGKKMSDDIAAGGPRASAALQLTLDKLRGIKDPALQAQIAVGLFGTQAEDMGKALLAIDPKSAVNALGQVGGAADRMGKTLNDTAQVRVESFKRAVMSKLTEAGGAILKVFSDISESPATKNFLGDARKVLDEKVMPALRRFSGWVQEKIVPLIHQWADGVRAQAVPILDRLQKALKDNEPELRALWEGFKAFADVVATKVMPAVLRMYFSALKPTWEFILNVLIPVFGHMIRHFLTGSKVILAGVSVFLNGIEKMAGVMRLIPGPIGKLWQTIYDKSKTARAGVDQVRTALDKVPKNTTAEVRANTAPAKAAVAALQTQLYNLVQRQYSAVISGRLDYFGNPIARKDGGMLPGPVNASRRRDNGVFAGQSGEWVTSVDRTKQYLPILKAIQAGTLEEHADGGLIGSPWWVRVGADVSRASSVAANVARSEQLALASAGSGRFRLYPGGWPGPYGNAPPWAANTAAAARAVRSAFPGQGAGSYQSPYSWSDHYPKAIDFMTNAGRPGGLARGNAISSFLAARAAQFGLKYLIWNRKFSSGSGWGPYSGTSNPHTDHVHASFFDQGGDLLPGWNTVFNGTGAVERLRPVQDGGQRSFMFAPTYNVANPVNSRELSRETVTRLMFVLSTGAAPAGGG